MLNIHPSILPLFPGLHTHERALAAGMAVHGCTVHEVTTDLDLGPILGQAVIPVEAGDTPESLAARVLVMEHRLYPAVLRRFARWGPLELPHSSAEALVARPRFTGPRQRRPVFLQFWGAESAVATISCSDSVAALLSIRTGRNEEHGSRDFTGGVRSPDPHFSQSTPPPAQSAPVATETVIVE